MGFNYLQTDDRDDYFAQFDKHRVRNTPPEYNVTDTNGVHLFKGTTQDIKIWAKKYFNVTCGKVRRGKWRIVLADNNCKWDEIKTTCNNPSDETELQKLNLPHVIKAVCDECDGSGWWKENEIDNVIVCPKCKGKQTDL